VSESNRSRGEEARFLKLRSDNRIHNLFTTALACAAVVVVVLPVVLLAVVGLGMLGVAARVDPLESKV
jgi:uncharacterized MnhB-related membrane protein